MLKETVMSGAGDESGRPSEYIAPSMGISEMRIVSRETHQQIILKYFMKH
jgi:hypothetical protein